MSVTSKKRFSLVIATLQDDGELQHCLSSIAKLAERAVTEVIVIDQNTDNHLAGVIGQFSAQLDIQHIRVNFCAVSRARNLGAQLAQGEWLGFPDDDCILFEDTLTEVHRLTSDPTLHVVTGQTVDETGAPNVLRWQASALRFDRWNMFGCMTEATLFIKRETFLQITGFSEDFGPGGRFPAAEGIELMNRLFIQQPTMGAIYSPTVKMQHPSKIPPWNRWAARRFFEYAKGDGGLVAKSPRRHILLWAIKTTGRAFIETFSFNGWRSVAFAARLAGLAIGIASGITYRITNYITSGIKSSFKGSWSGRNR